VANTGRQVHLRLEVADLPGLVPVGSDGLAENAYVVPAPAPGHVFNHEVRALSESHDHEVETVGIVSGGVEERSWRRHHLIIGAALDRLDGQAVVLRAWFGNAQHEGFGRAA